MGVCVVVQGRRLVRELTHTSPRGGLSVRVLHCGTAHVCLVHHTQCNTNGGWEREEWVGHQGVVGGGGGGQLLGPES